MVYLPTFAEIWPHFEQQVLPIEVRSGLPFQETWKVQFSTLGRTVVWQSTSVAMLLKEKVQKPILL